jgi:alanyl-tRNA synthetase
VFCSCNRYLEIYNLVLTQFNHLGSERVPLGCLNLDTGMGLERISMPLQNVNCVQETDVYWPFWQLLQFKGNSVKGKQLLDSLRTTSHLLTTNIEPKNTGQGYIVRRFIRRSLHLGRNLEVTSDEVWDSMMLYLTTEKVDIDLTRSKAMWNTECKGLERLFLLGQKPVQKMLEQFSVLGVEQYSYLWQTHGLPKDIVDEIIGN